MGFTKGCIESFAPGEGVRRCCSFYSGHKVDCFNHLDDKPNEDVSTLSSMKLRQFVRSNILKVFGNAIAD